MAVAAAPVEVTVREEVLVAWLVLPVDVAPLPPMVETPGGTVPPGQFVGGGASLACVFCREV